jgi:hypothetical protein
MSYDSESRGWLKPIARVIVRFTLYPALFILLYALSFGPVVYYHNRSVGGGRAGYAPIMNVVYAPLHRIERWIPFYDEYINWWLQP